MKRAASERCFSGPRQPRSVGPIKAVKIAASSARPFPASSAAFSSLSRSRLVTRPRDTNSSAISSSFEPK